MCYMHICNDNGLHMINIRYSMNTDADPNLALTPTLVADDFSDIDEYEEMSSDGSEVGDVEDLGVSDAMYQLWATTNLYDVPGAIIAEHTCLPSAVKAYNNHIYLFIHDLKQLLIKNSADVFCMRANVFDTETHDEVVSLLRFDNRPEFLETLAIHIANNIAGKGVRYEGLGSDTAFGKMVTYDLGYVKTINNRPIDGVVTCIVGVSTAFNGYTTKVINAIDHGIDYSSTDCLFICLNEALNLRLDPTEVKRKVLVDEPSSIDIERRTIDLLKKKHLDVVCKEYACSLLIHDVDSDKKYIINKNPKLRTIKIAKKGTAIGLVDGKSIIPSEPHMLETKGYAYYDFETVSYVDSTHVYGFTVLWEDGTLERLIHHDVELLHDSIRDSMYQHLLKTSCTIIYLNAWNGSGFDHRILMDITSSVLRLGKVIMNGANQILTADIGIEGKRYILRDPMKMWTGSLKQAAKSLLAVADEEGKLDIDHDAIQNAYLAGTLREYLDAHKQEIEAYALRDVTLLRDVTKKIREVYESSNILYDTSITRNSGTYVHWAQSLSPVNKLALRSISYSTGMTLPFAHREVTIDDVKSCAIGGRTQAMYGLYPHLTMVDFKSMYPSVAAVNLFPGNECISTTTYIPGAVGIYEVVVSSQNYPHVLPYRTHDDTYDYNSNHVIVRIVTNQDIEDLEHNGATFKVQGGVIWPNAVNYFETYMGNLVAKRQEAVDRKEKQLADHYKAMANALTGSMFQELKRELIQVFKTREDFIAYNKMHSRYLKIVGEHTYTDGQILVFYYPLHMTNEQDRMAQQEAYKNAITHKPILITMFIYSYARSKLYRLWKDIEDAKLGRVVLCDTDSLGIACDDANSCAKLRTMLEPMLGVELGKLEVEREDCEAVIIKRKMYGFRGGHIGNVLLTGTAEYKLRMKGVSMRSYNIIYNTRDEAEYYRNKSIYSDPNAEPLVSKWLNSKLLHDFYSRDIQPGYTYQHLLDIYAGRIMFNVDWSFVKVIDRIKKKYVIKLIGI